MAKSIENIAKNIPFSVKNVLVVFIFSVILWLILCLVLTIIVKISFDLTPKSYARIFLSQPEVLSLYILLYCVSIILLIWSLLIKKIKNGLGIFFNKENLREDLLYGFQLFVKSLGVVMLFFILLILLFATISKLFGLDFTLLKDIYLQGREEEIEDFYQLYKFNALIIFLAVIVGPIYEEIFYRGCLYTALRKRFSSLKSIMLSSLFFALIHGYVFNFFPVLLLGIILAYAYEKRSSLTASLLVHFGWNALSVILFSLKP